MEVSEGKRDIVKEDKIRDFEDDEKVNLPVARRASEFEVKYPSNPHLNDKENARIKNAVEKEGIAVGCKTYVSEKGVKDLLKTDKKGAAMVINNAPLAEVKSYGNMDYLSTPETQKVIAKRKEEARPQLEREYLATSSRALDAFSRCPQLEKERTIQSDRNVKDRPKIGVKVLKERNSEVSEVTGKKLDESGAGKPVVHHKERVADNPDLFSSDDNLIVMRDDEHREFHSDPELLPNKEGLEKYKKRKNNGS